MMRTFKLSSCGKCLKVLPVVAGMILMAGGALCAPVDSQNNQPLGAGGQTAAAPVSGAEPVSKVVPCSSCPTSVSAAATSSTSSVSPVGPVPASSPFARRLVLSNMEILGGGHLHRLSSRPPVFGPLKLKKHQESREERFLHLLFLVCALIGVFVAILALRSIPPASSKKES
jgi:hypothetical protein